MGRPLRGHQPRQMSNHVEKKLGPERAPDAKAVIIGPTGNRANDTKCSCRSLIPTTLQKRMKLWDRGVFFSCFCPSQMSWFAI